jgi:hypothetical protein
MTVICPHRRRVEREESQKMARLAQAECDLRDLQCRAERAVQTLDDRQRRNHFAESIRMTMRGT